MRTARGSFRRWGAPRPPVNPRSPEAPRFVERYIERERVASDASSTRSACTDTRGRPVPRSMFGCAAVGQERRTPDSASAAGADLVPNTEPPFVVRANRPPAREGADLPGSVWSRPDARWGGARYETPSAIGTAVGGSGPPGSPQPEHPRPRRDEISEGARVSYEPPVRRPSRARTSSS
jgi:hypothetical protein